ncbi:MAG TPA: sensor histidine kinase [Thermoanaerobaculia bacterium]|jgi:signal transduction histidine kinase
MTAALKDDELLDSGTLTFSVEGRILRELGERLVKQPEVALVELIKNAYDADATSCDVVYEPPESILIADDGHGMTLAEFENGWMRIGTSAKALEGRSRTYNRVITGEKGIGRFAVRFLGTELELRTVAYDPSRKMRTLLTASFDWPSFDQTEDLGDVEVPFTLRRAPSRETTGTSLRVTALRAPALSKINLDSVRTASIAVVTPYLTLLRHAPIAPVTKRGRKPKTQPDPGFTLNIQPHTAVSEDGDVARAILDNAVLRAVVTLEHNRVSLQVYRRGSKTPALKINDKYVNSIGTLYADIRFFPQRKGTFTDLPVDGRRAKTWLKEHAGVAIFDRAFRVLPYGTATDDWLQLAADTARRAREPRSSLAQKHFPMDEPTRSSTQLNYMLRLPYPEQLVGVVQVEGQRSADQRDADTGLVAAADREGFIDNAAFRQLRDIVRGAVEALAAADRELQLEQERQERADALRRLRSETRAAIREIEANPNIRSADKARIIGQLSETQALAEKHEERTREREAALEVMSLLGVVAGFMTHEFGAALAELEKSQRVLTDLGKSDTRFKSAAEGIGEHVASLREFVTYSKGYIEGASARPAKPYPARPRIQQVKRVFGKYADERRIQVDVEIDPDLIAPLVPVSLYNGIVLNLYTNALKAIISKIGDADRRIAFRAWNEQQWHVLEVSDTGVGIPTALRTRIFDPLFTTTSNVSNRDPLGSGMGLGLALVKRGTESYGGDVELVEPPPGFATCFRVRLPLVEQ